jgi:hypothetical protein
MVIVLTGEANKSGGVPGLEAAQDVHQTVNLAFGGGSFKHSVAAEISRAGHTLRLL